MLEKKVKELSQELASYFPSLNKRKGVKMVELHATNTTKGSNFSGAFLVPHLLKNGVKVPYNKTFSVTQSPDSATISDNGKNVDFFSKFVRIGEPLRFRVDFDTEEGRLLYMALCLKSDVYCDEYKNLWEKSSESKFTLVIPDEVALSKLAKIKEKISIATTLYGYKYDDIISLIFFLRKSPFSEGTTYRSHADALSTLIGENLDGWVMQNISLFKRFHDDTDNPNRATEILFSKAIAYNLIQYSNGVFVYNNSDTLGASEEQSINFIQKTSDLASRIMIAVTQIESSIQQIPNTTEEFREFLQQSEDPEVINTAKEASKFDPEQVETVKKMYFEEGQTLQKIADAMGINIAKVSMIKREIEKLDKQ